MCMNYIHVFINNYNDNNNDNNNIFLDNVQRHDIYKI